MIIEFLALIGGYVGLRKVVEVSRRLLIYWKPLNFDELRRNLGGDYVFITGATDGIGKELAIKLAKNGINVVVHGRNGEKLDQLLGELRLNSIADVQGWKKNFDPT
jgi:FlaA1/EpsC-like NDP-sugar epimerase